MTASALPTPTVTSVHLEALSERRLSAAQALLGVVFFHDPAAPIDVAKGLRPATTGEREMYWVALIDDAVVGVIGAWWPTQPGVVWVSWLAVQPGLQSRGIGRRLWQTMERGVANYPISALRVWTSGEYALAAAWYLRLGFRIIHTNCDIQVLSRRTGDDEPPLLLDHLI